MCFFFLETNIKFSPSIFHCLNVYEQSPVINIFLLSIQTPEIHLEPGTSIFLTKLRWFAFIIDIWLYPGISNKSFFIIINVSIELALLISFIEEIIFLSNKS